MCSTAPSGYVVSLRHEKGAASEGFTRFMEQLRQANDQLGRLNADIDRIHDEVRKANEKASGELERKRRSGELGRAWQVLQQRIDMRQTTERDIYSGVDKSNEAREVRALMAENARKLKQGMRKAADDDPDGDIAQGMRRLDEVRSRLDELQRRTSSNGSR